MSSIIRRLKIERFRGIESLSWCPLSAINVILGGGNVGKTTILEAIALLLSPTTSYSLSDSDYWLREVEKEFLIEAVMSLSENTGINQQSKMNWPWEWDGQNPVIPAEDPSSSSIADKEVVYVLRVRGTADMELAYEICQPDGEIATLSLGLRRSIGLVRLAGDDRNDRDLRLVHGSSLDKLLADQALRSRLGKQLADEKIHNHLSDDGKTALIDLDKRFRERALPSELGLGLTGGSGFSINALVGLTANKNEVTLPVSSWGSGTRRLAALTIADALQGAQPITVVDEIERGLEPYRQRTLIRDMKDRGMQVFLTTHSTTIISAASGCALWYVDSNGQIGQLPGDKIEVHQRSDPETFLARLSVICEGITEFGFVKYLLEKAIEEPLEDHGIWVSDGGGHDIVVNLLDALTKGGLAFAAMVDNEGRRSGSWTDIKAALGDLLFQWQEGCLESNIIPLFDSEKLTSFIEDPEEIKTGMRLRSLADRLGIQDTDFETISSTAGSSLLQIIIEAAMGEVPDKFKDEKGNVQEQFKVEAKKFKAHAKNWFKSKEGGAELAEKVLDLGAWPSLKPLLFPFINAIRVTVALPEIKGLPCE